MSAAEEVCIPADEVVIPATADMPARKEVWGSCGNDWQPAAAVGIPANTVGIWRKNGFDQSDTLGFMQVSIATVT
jgi:hypothetical protein